MLTSIQSMTSDLKSLSARLQGLSLPSPKAWSVPSPPFVKANLNVKYCYASNFSWSGVLIRDNQGYVLGACRCQVFQISSPSVAEAMSLVHVVLLAGDLGFHSIIFEGDSLALIKKMNSDAQNFLVISVLVWEAKGLARNLHACRFLFIPRGGNHAAHALAGESFLDSMDRF
ncbi:hypothetical protein V6N11_063167 [Hibiscus sabdariffa]|uniref:RNase H type-1 domain-containing protein n=2 Tax=Hibiscus sabdariffa TaxID=183260 RepID=A0ABR2B4R5_9ROSI